MESDDGARLLTLLGQLLMVTSVVLALRWSTSVREGNPQPARLRRAVYKWPREPGHRPAKPDMPTMGVKLPRRIVIPGVLGVILLSLGAAMRFLA